MITKNKKLFKKLIELTPESQRYQMLFEYSEKSFDELEKRHTSLNKAIDNLKIALPHLDNKLSMRYADLQTELKGEAKSIEKIFSLYETLFKRIDESKEYGKSYADNAKKEIGETSSKSVQSLDKKLKKEVDKIYDELQKLRDRGRGGSPNAWGGSSRTIYNNGQLISTHFSDLSLVAGPGITLTSSDDDVYDRAVLTIASTGGGFTPIAITGTVNGSNKSFTSTVTPTRLIIDGVIYAQKDQTASQNVQWSISGTAGAYTISTTIAPQSSIEGV